MFNKLFLTITLSIFFILPQSSFGGRTTLNFDDSGTPCFVDSNMAENYTYAYHCIPDFAATSTPCSYGGEHAVTRTPGLMPSIAEVRLNAALYGYGEAQFTIDSATINGEPLVDYNGASRVAEIGSWGVNINVNDGIEDGTAYAESDSAVFYWSRWAYVPEKKGGTWSGAGTVRIANVRWKGTSSVTVSTEYGSESTVSVGFEPGISHTVTLSNGRSITTEISDDMWTFSAHDSTSKSGSWSYAEELQCWICKSTLRDDLHEHYTVCYGCLDTYPCFKHPGNHVFEESCSKTDENGFTCTVEWFYQCVYHTHQFGSGSQQGNGGGQQGNGGGIGQNPGNGGGTCATCARISGTCSECTDALEANAGNGGGGTPPSNGGCTTTATACINPICILDTACATYTCIRRIKVSQRNDGSWVTRPCGELFTKCQNLLMQRGICSGERLTTLRDYHSDLYR